MATRTKSEPRRADALRNIDAIFDAARLTLARDPDASLADIAAAAGVGRVTLHTHFGTRADLVNAVVTRTLDTAQEAIAAVDLSGPSRDALRRLVDTCWQLVADSGSLLVAAERALPPERILAAHTNLMTPVGTFLERARADGEFRSDQPVSWQLAVFHGIVHTAATEIAAGRLDADNAGATITATLLAALRPG